MTRAPRAPKLDAMVTTPPTQTGFRSKLHRLRIALAESARDEEHESLWSGPAELDRVESLSVSQCDRLLRRGLVRRSHGES
jgi:hypothetical protein